MLRESSISNSVTRLDSYGGPRVGLGRDGIASTGSLIDDAPSRTYWFTAIGATKYHGGADTIPGPKPHVVTKVELYVFIQLR